MAGRITVDSMLCEQGLGYCCPWFFFQHFRHCATIADRLGVTVRAVQYAKARVDNGQSVCAKLPNCLHARITLEGGARKRPLTPPTAPDSAPE